MTFSSFLFFFLQPAERMEQNETMLVEDECLDLPSTVQFDGFPKVLLKGNEVESLPLRASFIPGLLNLSEVDLILRGKFKPPFEETTRSEVGGGFSNITASGGKKVSIACISETRILTA
jgi:hypothetical protein